MLKKACEIYQSLPKEKKEKQRQYHTEDEQQNLVEYRKKMKMRKNEKKRFSIISINHKNSLLFSNYEKLFSFGKFAFLGKCKLFFSGGFH